MPQIEIPCVCPVAGTHTTDTVTLPPTLGFTQLSEAVMAVRWYIAQHRNAGDAAILAYLQEVYLLHTLGDWTCVAADGSPLPLTEENIRQYLIAGNPSAAFDVADLADDLYGAAVIHPLVERAQRSSQRSPTGAPTSAKRPRGQSSRKPRLQSLTTTSPTADTAATA